METKKPKAKRELKSEVSPASGDKDTPASGKTGVVSPKGPEVSGASASDMPRTTDPKKPKGAHSLQESFSGHSRRWVFKRPVGNPESRDLEEGQPSRTHDFTFQFAGIPDEGESSRTDDDFIFQPVGTAAMRERVTYSPAEVIRRPLRDSSCYDPRRSLESPRPGSEPSRKPHEDSTHYDRRRFLEFLESPRPGSETFRQPSRDSPRYDQRRSLESPRPGSQSFRQPSLPSGHSGGRIRKRSLGFPDSWDFEEGQASESDDFIFRPVGTAAMRERVTYSPAEVIRRPLRDSPCYDPRRSLESPRPGSEASRQPRGDSLHVSWRRSLESPRPGSQSFRQRIEDYPRYDLRTACLSSRPALDALRHCIAMTERALSETSESASESETEVSEKEVEETSGSASETEAEEATESDSDKNSESSSDTETVTEEDTERAEDSESVSETEMCKQQ